MSEQSGSMDLRGVTLTGLDESTDLDRVVWLYNKFRFVEWAVLLSPTKTGNDPRYPSLEKVKEISRLNGKKLQVSYHLCGEYARMAVNGNYHGILQMLPFLDYVSGSSHRVQVNVGSRVDSYPAVLACLKDFALGVNLRTILQTSDFDCAEFDICRGKMLPSGVSLLHDASGGRGICGAFERPINNDYVGFAGGLSPENVAEKIESIVRFRGVNDYWVDMETHIRTNNVLDLAKCHKVLKISKGYVK